MLTAVLVQLVMGQGHKEPRAARSKREQYTLVRLVSCRTKQRRTRAAHPVIGL
jgi:hypothetical protein